MRSRIQGNPTTSFSYFTPWNSSQPNSQQKYSQIDSSHLYQRYTSLENTPSTSKSVTYRSVNQHLLGDGSEQAIVPNNYNSPIYPLRPEKNIINHSTSQNLTYASYNDQSSSYNLAENKLDYHYLNDPYSQTQSIPTPTSYETYYRGACTSDLADYHRAFPSSSESYQPSPSTSQSYEIEQFDLYSGEQPNLFVPKQSLLPSYIPNIIPTSSSYYENSSSSKDQISTAVDQEAVIVKPEYSVSSNVQSIMGTQSEETQDSDLIMNVEI